MFDTLVVTCLTSEVDNGGYVCLADNRLWHHLDKAPAFERSRPRLNPFGRMLFSRMTLALFGVGLFVLLVVAVASKIFAT